MPKRRADQLELENHSALREALKVEDDWTGKTDSKERRKLQNRLHQRAWRRKKAAENAGSISEPRERERGTGNLIDDAFVRAAEAFGIPNASKQESPSDSVRCPPLVARRLSTSQDDPHPLRESVVTSTHLAVLPTRPARITIQPKPNPLIPPILTSPYGSSVIIFPLSPDHHLLTLVQYNVLRAIITNLALCDILSTLPSTCRASMPPCTTSPPSTIPPTFAPTYVQRSVTHPNWIDTVPCAQLRDNLILSLGSWDEDELCEDMCGGLYEGYDDVVQRGMLVWDEPWRVGSWEVTEGFVGKWGWLLRGCDDMFQATNFWREGRGEEALVFEVD